MQTSQRYVDEAAFADRWKQIVRQTTLAVAILLPLAFFLSVRALPRSDRR
jgi:hypothetical protein